jgi:metal-dependent hydrolase (beta-lactamase superfamily II)
MSLDFIVRGCESEGLSVRVEEALLAVVTDLVWDVLAGFHRGRDCKIGMAMNISGLLKFVIIAG